jgi:hypothetical protein
MIISIRSLLLAVSAGSSLLLLSGCADVEVHEGYHHHTAYGYGHRSGYYDGDYGHRPYYGERSRVVVVAPRGPSPYYRSGYRSRGYYAPSTTYYRGRSSSNVVVNVSTKPKKKTYYRY